MWPRLPSCIARLRPQADALNQGCGSTTSASSPESDERHAARSRGLPTARRDSNIRDTDVLGGYEVIECPLAGLVELDGGANGGAAEGVGVSGK
jgi:hypothetical protein